MTERETAEPRYYPKVKSGPTLSEKKRKASTTSGSTRHRSRALQQKEKESRGKGTLPSQKERKKRPYLLS